MLIIFVFYILFIICIVIFDSIIFYIFSGKKVKTSREQKLKNSVEGNDKKSSKKDSEKISKVNSCLFIIKMSNIIINLT